LETLALDLARGDSRPLMGFAVRSKNSGPTAAPPPRFTPLPTFLLPNRDEWRWMERPTGTSSPPTTERTSACPSRASS
jgi:hypothetical protein